MIVQLIGLPCSGKSTLLKKFYKDYSDWKIYDIVDYKNELADSNLFAENKILKSICNNYWTSNFIIESACGFNDLNSKVIKLEPTIELLRKNFIKREGSFTNKDLEYLRYLNLNCINYDNILYIDEHHQPEQIYQSFIKILKYELFI